MKKLLAILALLILSFALIGCTKEVAAPREPVTSAPSAPMTPEGAPAEEPMDTQTAPGEETTEEGAAEEAAAEPAVILPGEGDVTEKKLEQKVDYSLPIDLTEETEHFDQVTCSDVDGVKTISVKVTNSADITWLMYSMENPKGNVRITNRGITDATPGCEKQELAPGESTICSTVDIGTISGENRISIQAKSGTEAKVVSCP